MFFLRRLLWLLALLGAFWAVRRLLSGGTRQAGQPRGAGSVPERGEGDLVRDRVCNTFLPRARALTLKDQTGEHFLCSEHCRQIHVERETA